MSCFKLYEPMYRQVGRWVVVGLSHMFLGTCTPQGGEAELQNAQPSHGDSHTVQMLWITGVFLDLESYPSAGIENIHLNLDSFSACLVWHLRMVPLWPSLAYGLGLLKASLSWAHITVEGCTGFSWVHITVGTTTAHWNPYRFCRCCLRTHCTAAEHYEPFICGVCFA